MISALKKFARKNDDTKNRPAMPSGVSSMGQSLQRKFGRGVQYNSMYCLVLWLLAAYKKYVVKSRIIRMN